MALKGMSNEHELLTWWISNSQVFLW